MLQRNGSNSGTFTIESGANHLSELGFIKAWNGNSKLNFWEDQYCDMINGTSLRVFRVFHVALRNIVVSI